MRTGRGLLPAQFAAGSSAVEHQSQVVYLLPAASRSRALGLHRDHHFPKIPAEVMDQFVLQVQHELVPPGLGMARSSVPRNGSRRGAAGMVCFPVVPVNEETIARNYTNTLNGP